MSSAENDKPAGRPKGWLKVELDRAHEQMQRMPTSLGGKGNRWAWFTGEELGYFYASLPVGLMLGEVTNEIDRRRKALGVPSPQPTRSDNP